MTKSMRLSSEGAARHGQDVVDRHPIGCSCVNRRRGKGICRPSVRVAGRHRFEPRTESARRSFLLRLSGIANHEIGQRLAGTEAHKRAVAWAEAKLKAG